MIAGIRTFSISEFEFTETLSSAGRLDLRISMRKADRVSSDAQDAGRLSRLKIVRQILAELQMRVMQLAREGSPPPRLRLLQAKLSRNSNQIARGRIRRFESDMPSQPVRSLNGMSWFARISVRDYPIAPPADFARCLGDVRCPCRRVLEAARNRAA
jgi:hypothetical protein